MSTGTESQLFIHPLISFFMKFSPAIIALRLLRLNGLLSLHNDIFCLYCEALAFAGMILMPSEVQRVAKILKEHSE